VTSWWQGHGAFKHGTSQPRYVLEHVQVMASMLARHGGHKLTCVTDDPAAVRAAGIHAISMPPEVRKLPTFLPKLWLWSEELGQEIGERYACIDLDALVLADLAPLLYKAEMVIWNWCGGEYYNTSLFALDPGCRSRVWSEFSMEAMERAKKDWLHRQIVDGIGRHRSTVWTGDQSWVSWLLGPGEATISPAGAVRQFRHVDDAAAKPPGVRVFFFCGPMCPQSVARDVPWVAREWR